MGPSLLPRNSGWGVNGADAHTFFRRSSGKFSVNSENLKRKSCLPGGNFSGRNACSIYDFSQQFSTMLNLAERGELLSLPDGRFRRIPGHFWRKKKGKHPTTLHVHHTSSSTSFTFTARLRRETS